MTIKFADGTHIEIAATAYNDFVKHDLKWAEFVHGRATVKKLTCKEDPRKLVPSTYNDFVKHDLKWAEFVHGRATVKKLTCKEDPRKLVPSTTSLGRSVHPCPAGGC